MSDQLTVDGRGCVICAGPIPAGSRSHRQTCSAACRQTLSRRARRESVTPKAAGPRETGLASVETAAPPSMSTPSVSPVAPGLSHDLAAIAAAIATPIEGGFGCHAYCEVRAGGFGAVFGRDAGRHPVAAGPVFERPRQAIDLAELLNTRLVAAA